MEQRTGICSWLPWNGVEMRERCIPFSEANHSVTPGAPELPKRNAEWIKNRLEQMAVRMRLTFLRFGFFGLYCWLFGLSGLRLLGLAASVSHHFNIGCGSPLRQCVFSRPAFKDSCESLCVVGELVRLGWRPVTAFVLTWTIGLGPKKEMKFQNLLH